MDTQSVQKAFHCKNCDAIYKSVTSFQQHKRSRKPLLASIRPSNIKSSNTSTATASLNPIKCKICQKSFNSYCQYRKHTLAKYEHCSYNKTSKNFFKNVDRIEKLSKTQQYAINDLYCKLASENKLKKDTICENVLFEVNAKALGKDLYPRGQVPSEEKQLFAAKSEAILIKCPDTIDKKAYKNGQYKTHVCKICTKSFRKKSDYKRHLDRHNQVKSFQCNKCDKSFNNRSQLNQHNKLVHEKTAKIECHICKKFYVNKSSLKVHMTKHLSKTVKK